MNTLAMRAGEVLWVGSVEAPASLRELVGRQGWGSRWAGSAVEALRYLRGHGEVDLVVVVPGRELGAYTELCRGIKFDKRTGFLSVVFIVEQGDSAEKQKVLNAGADDWIPMEAPEEEIALRLRRAMRLKQATGLLEDASAVVLALANAVEGKDAYTCGHVERVGTYSVQIGKRMGLSEDDLSALRTGGAVHDIGKIGIPDQILNKPGKLTEEETLVMQRHPVIGYDILKPLRTFQAVLPIVRWHHEKPNGRGYPDGIKGEEIPLLARIAAAADVFDALATDRPYRAAFPISKCVEILKEFAGKGELDEGVVGVLVGILDEGMMVGKLERAA